MRRFIFGFLVVLSGCKPTETKAPVQSEEAAVNNPATRYVSEMQSDVDRARQSVKKMNDGISKTEKAIQEGE
ncbi:MAG: hypothetical protein KCHDKBKB_01712 [Elusimicrobia bacterium]|nr:hypothetical protein [Elusimicrobiota bacterium]